MQKREPSQKGSFFTADKNTALIHFYLNSYQPKEPTATQQALLSADKDTTAFQTTLTAECTDRTFPTGR